MSARLILEDVPGAWVDLEFRGQVFRARMDPMWLGAEQLVMLIDRPPMVRALFDEASHIRAVASDPFGRHTPTLLEAYVDAVGLGLEGLVHLIDALKHLDLLEVDLLRLGLDVKDWLDPEGPLSSRRVALLVKDFQARPETNLGARQLDVFPLSKGEILLAQYVGGPKEGGPNMFLKSPSELEAERKAKVEDAEKRRRIQTRGF